MPSKTFQPLLFDSFKYKLPDSTYVDHYGKKYKRKEFNTIYRAFSGIVSQRDRMSLMTQRSRPFTSSSSFMKNFNKFYYKSSNNSSSRANVNFDQKVSVKQISRQGSSAGTSSVSITNLENIEKNHVKLVSPPPPTPPTTSPTKSLVDAPVETNEKVTIEKSKTSITKNERKYEPHWMVFQQETTPNYILEAKKRLGQIKEPHVAPNQVKEKPPKAPEKVKKEENVKVEQNQIETVKTINKHWLQWDNPRTPENIVEIRRRLGDDRYRKNNTLYNFQRSKTISAFDRSHSECSVKEKDEQSKTPVEKSDSRLKEEEVQTVETRVDENGVKYIVSYEPDAEIIQTSLKTNLPVYHQIANTFNYFDKENESIDKYFEETVNLESGNDTKKFILPTKDSEKASNNDENPKAVPFQSWLRTASDEDRDAVLKILSDIERDKPRQASALGHVEARVSSRLSNNQYNNYSKVKSKNNSNQSSHPQILLKKRPNTSSSVRKLGVTRNKYDAPVDENLEKILIKHTLWSNEINGPATVHFGYNV